MTGIGGVKMWMMDFMMNESSYPKEYRDSYIKIEGIWNSCIKEFKSAKSIKNCNDTYSKYIDEIDNLREELYKQYGRNRLPIGIGDLLDYFDEAVGELEDKYIDKLTENGGKFTTFLPTTYPRDIIQGVKHQYQRVNYHLDFTIKGDQIKVSGEFWDVRTFLENNFYRNDYEKAIDEGVFENA